MANSIERARGQAGYWLYLIPGAIGFVLIIFLPFIMNTGLSFSRWKGIGLPKFVGLNNYIKLINDAAFWASLEHTVAFVVAMAVIPTILGVFLAAILFDYISARFGEGLSSFFRAGFYLPQILPISAAGILWGWILNPFGVLNSILEGVGLHDLAQNWLGDPRLAIGAVMVVMVWLQLGYCLVVFMAGLARVDPSLNEAAELDGATWLQRFWTITVPLLKPEIFVVGLTTTIAALKVFAPIYVLTSGGPDNSTLVPSYFSYYHFFATNRVGYGAAITTAQMLMTIVLGIIFLRVQAHQTENGA
ncbi:sugar ABC transporter permease [Devosia algicola]|uniref:Sugar ABC transporter permease n=1 Tax=Devosia algicola TaxID=3026418 RepID=A0ABY7YMT3_9HYPH|nr:sugar ABC transporter permease [Devosia algicola]WDR02395.1 sugar ABC transporter permease [Devosia algicola]